MTTNFVFHLIVEHTDSGHDNDGQKYAAGHGRVWKDPLPLSQQVVYLSVDNTGFSLLPSWPGVRAENYLVCQPMNTARPPRLLLFSPFYPLKVNGQPAPSVAVLSEGDEIIVDESSGSVGHLALFFTRRTSPLPDRPHTGACPLCRVAFTAGTTVYECANCGTRLHMEGEETRVEDRLTCALMAEACPVCSTRVQLKAGYNRLPDHIAKGG